MEKELTLTDILLDENNEDPITLDSSTGERVTFDQVAVIPLCDEIFAILKPIEGLEGLGEDEALVFMLDGDSIAYVDDEVIGKAIFDRYYALLDEKEDKDDAVFGEEEEKELAKRVAAFKEAGKMDD